MSPSDSVSADEISLGPFETERTLVRSFNELARRVAELENAEPFPGSYAAYRDNTGGQDLNTAAGVAIDWDTEVQEDIGFTHSVGVNPSRIAVDADGQYLVHACVSGENQTANPKNVRIRLRVNGSTYQSYAAYGYANDATDEWLTCALTGVILSLSANDYIEVIANGEGSEVGVGACNSVADASHITVIRVK